MSIETARARLEDAMVDDIVFTRRTREDTYSSATGAVTTAPTDEVYAGECLITRRGTIARETMRGGETEYVDQYKVSVPFDGGPFAIGDVGDVRGCVNDPDLAGQQLRVTTITYGSNIGRRQLTCDLIKVGPR